MKKQLLTFGKELTRKEQKQVHGGFGFGSGCTLDVYYEDGGFTTIPFEGNEMLDPFGTMACNAHAQEVSPRLVHHCVLHCGAL
jgi:hypothetical protein